MVVSAYRRVGSLGPMRGKWRMEMPIAAQSIRVYVQAWWDDPRRIRPLSVEQVGWPEHRGIAFRTDGSYLMLQDLPADPPRALTLICASTPDRILVRPITQAPFGASVSGIFPRCLASKIPDLANDDYELVTIIEALEKGDFEGALAFAGRLCLVEALPSLDKLVHAVAAYARIHMLHRCDEFALFAAALSGLRSSA